MLPRGIREVRIKDTREHVLRFFSMQSSPTESEATNALLHIDFQDEVVIPDEVNEVMIADESYIDMNKVQSKSVLHVNCKRWWVNHGGIVKKNGG
ncbi:hypothetical protein SLA2020_522160 [Shorea laevis]